MTVVGSHIMPVGEKRKNGAQGQKYACFWSRYIASTI